MYCPNCGNQNPEGVAFCIGCGMALKAAAPQPAAQPVVAAQPASAPAPAPAPQPVAQPVVAAQPQPVYQPVAPQPQVQQQPGAAPQPQPQAEPKKSDMLPFGQHFKNIFKAAIHPVTGPSEISKQYDKIGNAIFLAGIVIVILGLVTFISSMSMDLILFAKTGRYYPGNIVIDIILDFFFSFIFYAIRTFGFAGLFMLAGLILKQKWSFPRFLAIASLAAAPVYIVDYLLGSFIGLIPVVRFDSIIYAAAGVFYFVMLYEGCCDETKLTGNKKGIVFVIVFAVMAAIAGYFSYFLA